MDPSVDYRKEYQEMKRKYIELRKVELNNIVKTSPFLQQMISGSTQRGGSDLKCYSCGQANCSCTQCSCPACLQKNN